MAEVFELPKLPYEFHELEPVISRQIMELHWDKHHRAYVTNLNKALQELEVAQKEGNLGKAIELQKAIRFNGGGHINHSIFWTNLAPVSKGGGAMVSGALEKELNTTFGSLDKFIEIFSQKAVAHQGSGWLWLGYNKGLNRVEIKAMDNQDPLAACGLIPLFGIDVWEHAYYLDYKNVRAEYVKNIWKVVNFKDVEERLQRAKK